MAEISIILSLFQSIKTIVEYWSATQSFSVTSLNAPPHKKMVHPSALSPPVFRSAERKWDESKGPLFNSQSLTRIYCASCRFSGKIISIYKL